MQRFLTGSKKANCFFPRDERVSSYIQTQKQGFSSRYKEPCFDPGEHKHHEPCRQTLGNHSEDEGNHSYLEERKKEKMKEREKERKKERKKEREKERKR
jgi:hypothetical protein